MKLIIFDFDGPINDLTNAKKMAIEKTAEELSISVSEKNVVVYCPK